MAFTPPSVDPKELRPRRGWYAAAVSIALLGIAAGLGLFIGGLVSVLGGLPRLEQQFAAGESVTVQLPAEGRRALYGLGPAPDSECTATSDGVVVSPAMYTFQFTRGTETWVAVADVHAARAGTYTLTCQGSAGAYALGEPPQVGRFMGTLFGTILSLFAFPVLGLVAGGCVGLVVGLRRSSHRKELQRQRFWPSPPFPY